MDKATVFYSWQSDLPPQVTRTLIEEALEEALKRANTALHIDLTLEQDSRGDAGSPKIADSVQEKIRRAIVFVADLTLVVPRQKRGGVPNGCVCVEWGWAEEALGSQALIGVMNTEYGGHDDLPVDIRQNLVRVKYELAEASSDAEIAAAGQELIGQLEKRLIGAVQSRFFKGFHPEAPPLVRYLITNSGDGLGGQTFGPEELAKLAGLSEEAALTVLEDLRRFGLAGDGGYGGSGFRIRCEIPLYVYFDPLYRGWNADRDAAILAKKLIGRGWSAVEALCQELDWSPRQINPAIFRLLQGFARASKASGGAPFYCLQLEANENTRSLAEGRASLPPLTSRALFQLD